MTDEHFIIIREDIATLRREMTDRLDRLNGSVGRHEAQIAVLGTQAHVQGSCPMVGELIRDVTKLQQEHIATSRVWKVAAAVGSLVTGLLAVVLDWVRH